MTGKIHPGRAEDKFNNLEVVLSRKIYSPTQIDRSLLPTPAANEAKTMGAEPVDKDGNAPSHINQRFYHPETGRLIQRSLSNLARAGMLPTPTASQDVRNISQPPSQMHRDHIPGHLFRVGIEGHLSPKFDEQLMGYPVGWTDKLNPMTADSGNLERDQLRLTVSPVCIGDPDERDRNKRVYHIGNAIVPHVAVEIFLAIIKAETFNGKS
jgi:hypothetical protein